LPVAEFRAWYSSSLAKDLAGTHSVPAIGRRVPSGGLDLRYPILDGGTVRLLAAKLREARRALVERPVLETAEGLGAVGRRFLDSTDPIRSRALELLPPTAGVSPPMAVSILDGMAADWTTERLIALLRSEFGDPAVRDHFVLREGRGRVRALGPAFAVHLSSGNVPGVAVTSMLRSLLVGTAVLMKPGRGDVVLPVLFVEALAAHDPELAAAVAVMYWPGGEGGVEEEVLSLADLVVAYGSDSTVRAVRNRLPPHVPLVAYRHRASVALVGRNALGLSELPAAAREVARAVALFDQRGCVSPQVVWVEVGGEASPAEFAEAVADALRTMEGDLPGGDLGDDEAALLQQRRVTAELLAASGDDVRVWTGDGSHWTVVFESGSDGPGGGPGRFIRIRPIEDARELDNVLAPMGPHLQTVAVAGLGDRIEPIAESLARVGVVRIAALENASWPPPWWHHDGEGPLQALVRWVDLEEPL
jgi:hypothetical protein